MLGDRLYFDQTENKSLDLLPDLAVVGNNVKMRYLHTKSVLGY